MIFLGTSKRHLSLNFQILSLLALALLFCSASLIVHAQTTPSIKTDLGVYPEPAPPALPRAGGKFLDPTFGTELMRVTDETGGGNAGTAYSYWPTFNCNSTRILVQRDGNTSGELYDFDPESFTLGAKQQIPLLPNKRPLRGEDAIWSSHDPDVLYGHTDYGAQIWAYNVRTQAFTLVGDLATRLLPGGSSIFQMSKSDDDDVFAATVRAGDPSWAFLGYIAYRASTNTVLQQDATVIDECQVDKTGRWLYIQTALQ